MLDMLIFIAHFHLWNQESLFALAFLKNLFVDLIRTFNHLYMTSEKSPNKKNKIIIILQWKYPFVQSKMVSRDHHNFQDLQDSLQVDYLKWLWGGLALMLLSNVLEHFKLPTEAKIILHFIRDLGIAISSGAIIAKIIEVPNFINFINERTIESLSDNKFLVTLKGDALEVIKKKCSRLIFQKRGKKEGEHFLNDSLIEYESELSNLVLKPFHEYYKVSIICEDDFLNDANGIRQKFMKKTTRRNYKIVNPLKESMNLDNIIPPLNMHCPENFVCRDLFKLNKLIVSTDNSKEKKNLTDFFEPKIDSIEVKHPDYNSRIVFTKGNNCPALTFNSEIVIEIEDVRYIAYSDPIYVMRVNKPTKNFSINYIYYNKGFRLKIECFAANANFTDGSFIKVENDQSVTLDVLSWLLPGNGILVATIPLENITKE